MGYDYEVLISYVNIRLEICVFVFAQLLYTVRGIVCILMFAITLLIFEKSVSMPATWSATEARPSSKSLTLSSRSWLFISLLPSATKLRQGNVFYTCLSFCSQGDIYHTPPGKTPPWADPQGKHPPRRHP